MTGPAARIESAHSAPVFGEHHSVVAACFRRGLFADLIGVLMLTETGKIPYQSGFSLVSKDA
jgi:hypothetical protein